MRKPLSLEEQQAGDRRSCPLFVELSEVEGKRFQDSIFAGESAFLVANHILEFGDHSHFR